MNVRFGVHGISPSVFSHLVLFPCSTLLDGEYGLSNLCIGVPVILGNNGIENIIEINLDEVELNHLRRSAEGVKATNSLLNDLDL